MQAADIVIASDKVISHYGEWPEFHDMEVVSLLLDRRGPIGPSAEFTIFAWSYTGRLAPEGHYEQQMHALIRFRCEYVTASNLEGFNNQNVLDGLHFTAGDQSVRVIFPSTYGIGGFIDCARVQVLDVIRATSRGEPAGEVL
jgi:hypothetical protein